MSYVLMLILFIILFVSVLYFVLQKIRNKYLIVPADRDSGDVKSYIEMIESGAYKNRVCYGIADKARDFYALDPVKQPGALFAGGMGSGKSIAMRFTLATHFMTNAENTLYILMDPAKGMGDYTLFFDGKHIDASKNVVTGISEDVAKGAGKIVPLIEMLWDEYIARNTHFKKMGVNDIYAYDRAMKKNNADDPGLARIMVFIEEFSFIPNSDFVKFPMKVDVDGTIANKFKNLMRVSRSAGISFYFATQRATGEDIPGGLKPGLTTMLCFKMNNMGDAAAMNLPHGQDISSEQRGRCAYEKGFIQFPYLEDEPLIVLLKKYYKPLKARLLKHQVSEYKVALESDGTSGMVEIKPMLQLIEFNNQYDSKDIVRKILRIFKYDVENQENKSFVADLVATKNGKRYAIRIYTGAISPSKKEFEGVKKGAALLKCDEIIIFGLDQRYADNLTSYTSDPKVKAMDFEDLKQFARMYDSRETLIKSNQYKEMFLGFALASSNDFESEDIVAESKIINEEDVGDEIIAEKSKALEITKQQLIDSGEIDNPKRMKELLFDKKNTILGLSDVDRLDVIKKLKISPTTAFIDYNEIKNKKVEENVSYYKNILKNEHIIVQNISDKEKNEILNKIDLIEKQNSKQKNEEALSLILDDNDYKKELPDISDDVFLQAIEVNMKRRQSSMKEKSKTNNELRSELDLDSKGNTFPEDGGMTPKPVKTESLLEVRSRLMNQIKKEKESAN